MANQSSIPVSILLTWPLNIYMNEIYENNVEHGWFDTDRSFGEGAMLMVTEVVEAVEEFRVHGLESYLEGEKPCGVGSELADIFIRLMDQFKRAGLDPDHEVQAKMAYNKTRPYRHGNKSM